MADEQPTPAPTPKVSRPYKWTDERKDALIAYLEEGATRHDACDGVGVSYASLKQHMARDEEWKIRVRKAEVKGVLAAGKVFVKAASKNWKAAAEYLRRKRPDEWGPRTEIKFDPSTIMTTAARDREMRDALANKLLDGATAKPDGEASDEDEDDRDEGESDGDGNVPSVEP